MGAKYHNLRADAAAEIRRLASLRGCQVRERRSPVLWVLLGETLELEGPPHALAAIAKNFDEWEYREWADRQW